MALMVSDLMTPNPYTVRPRETVRRVTKLMRTHNIRHIPVVDSAHQPLGIISKTDLLSRGLIGQHLEDLSDQLDALVAESVMTRLIHFVRPDDPAERAGSMMSVNGYSCMPVVKRQRIVGIITLVDYVAYVVKNARTLGSEPAGV